MAVDFRYKQSDAIIIPLCNNTLIVIAKEMFVFLMVIGKRRFFAIEPSVNTEGQTHPLRPVFSIEIAIKLSRFNSA